MGWEDPLEKGMANHSIILAWRIPWEKEFILYDMHHIYYIISVLRPSQTHKIKPKRLLYKIKQILV